MLTLTEAEARGPRGTVFGPVTARTDAPITVIIGGRGSGRTSLLLSLGGRMRLSAGALSVNGLPSPGRLSALRRETGLVGFTGIDELEPAVSVGAIVRERLAWATPWYRRASRLTEALLADVLTPAFGETPVPGPTTLVRDLTQAQDRLLRVALALIECPNLLLVDDFDDLRDPADRAMVASRLRALATHGVRSVVVTADPRDLELFGPDTAQIHLGN